MIVNINFETVTQEAQKRAEQMVKNGLYSRFNLSYQKRIDKALLGCIGELAFENYLKQNQVPYHVDQSNFEEVNSDEYDFLIGKKKIDIKVAKKSTSNAPNDYWTYGYPEEQKPFTKDYVIVGWVDFIQKQVGFYGWIYGAEISKYPVVKKNSFAGYPYLTPNHEFKWGSLNKNIALLIKNLK